MSASKFHVITGPYRTARRYAESMGWPPEHYVIVVRGHQLSNLDPARIASIISVKMHTLGQRVASEIVDEINRLHTLWSVPTWIAA